MPPKHEPMVMVKELCIDCAVCREVCPYTAVFFVPTQWKIALQVDQARCTGCGECVPVCPTDCLAMAGPLPWMPRPGDCISCSVCCLICPADALTMAVVKAA